MQLNSTPDGPTDVEMTDDEYRVATKKKAESEQF